MKGARGLGRAGLRDMLEDDRAWCVGARVELHAGEADHWQVNEDGDLEVTVVTHQHGTEITALLGGIAGGNGRGTWRVPSVGTEGVVVFLDGDFEGDAVFLGGMSSKNVPSGVSDVRTLIVDGEVEVRGDTNIELDAPQVQIGGNAVQATIMGDTYRSAEDLMLTAVSAVFNLLTAGPVTAPAAAAAVAAVAAITTFKNAAATYKTTVAKVK